MSDGKDTESGSDQAKGRLSLRPAGRLELGRTVDAGSVKQSFSHGRTKNVQVEIRKTRPTGPATMRGPLTGASIAAATQQAASPAPAPPPAAVSGAPASAAGAAAARTTAGAAAPAAAARPGAASRSPTGGRALTQAELATRQRVLGEAAARGSQA